MFSITRSLITLAAEVFDAGFVAMSSLVSDRALDDLGAHGRDDVSLAEIVEHLGAVHALLEDIRNLLNAQTASSVSAQKDDPTPYPRIVNGHQDVKCTCSTPIHTTWCPRRPFK